MIFECQRYEEVCMQMTIISEGDLAKIEGRNTEYQVYVFEVSSIDDRSWSYRPVHNNILSVQGNG